MDISIELVLIGLVVATIAHIYALAISRGSRSLAATSAFWTGILGLISVPVAFAVTMTAVPYFVTGPGERLSQAVTIAWSAVAILPVVSFLSATAVLVARKRPN